MSEDCCIWLQQPDLHTPGDSLLTIELLPMVISNVAQTDFLVCFSHQEFTDWMSGVLHANMHQYPKIVRKRGHSDTGGFVPACGEGCDIHSCCQPPTLPLPHPAYTRRFAPAPHPTPTPATWDRRVVCMGGWVGGGVACVCVGWVGGLVQANSTTVFMSSCPFATASTAPASA